MHNYGSASSLTASPHLKTNNPRELSFSSSFKRLSKSATIMWIQRATPLHPSRQVFLLFPAELQTDGF